MAAATASASAAAPGSTLRISPEHFAQVKKELGTFVGIASVSNKDDKHDYNTETLQKAADFTVDKLKQLGFKVETTRVNGSPPFVMAERITDLTKPTILLYGHYDVQPVDRTKWSSRPFVMTEKDNRLYGRGSSDDKGGIMAIFAALETYKNAKGELPVNVKILFEGEEEVGSPNMTDFLRENADKLNAHALVVMDGMNIGKDAGTLTSSTRGLLNLILRIKALIKPVHSGIGGLAPDPVPALCKLVLSLTENPRAIPGFLDGCEQLSAKERDLLRQSSVSAEQYAHENGLLPGAKLRGDPKLSIFERVLEEPSISIVNMNSGQPNGGNSIQDVATCQVGVRLTPGQNPEHVAKCIVDYLRSQPINNDLQLEIEQMGKGSYSWKANLDGPFTSTYLKCLGDNFKTVAAAPMGGAIPFLREFQLLFPKMEIMIPGVEDPKTSAHSHDESQDITVLENAINSLIAFIDRAQHIPIKV